MTEQTKMWTVFYSDEREGESKVIGPFFEHNLAKAFAARVANEKRLEYVMDMEHSDDYFAIMTGADDEIVVEITVMEMIPPYG